MGLIIDWAHPPGVSTSCHVRPDLYEQRLIPGIPTKLPPPPQKNHKLFLFFRVLQSVALLVLGRLRSWDPQNPTHKLTHTTPPLPARLSGSWLPANSGDWHRAAGGIYPPQSPAGPEVGQGWLHKKGGGGVKLVGEGAGSGVTRWPTCRR